MRSGVMLAYPFEEKRLNKWNTSQVIIQPKLDGERCRAIFMSNGEVILMSSEQNLITSVPHINAELKELGFVNKELDGELYIHGKEFESIHSIVGRTVNEHYNSASMQFHIFDIVRYLPQIVRLSLLKQIMQETDSIKLVPYKMINKTSIMSSYEEYILDGYEGFIIRNPNSIYERKRSTNMMKFKPKKQDIYRIVGYEEEISIHGNAKDSLGALILKGDDGTAFKVGSGFTREQRIILWSQRDYLKDKWCVVNYQHMTTKNKVPRFPIFVEIKEDFL